MPHRIKTFIGGLKRESLRLRPGQTLGAEANGWATKIGTYDQAGAAMFVYDSYK